ncbi:unnamed protein product [Blepharisma stoltei]|uniref:Uncharacterized protein n=1 Tax=Blepharisma stoltei TaxID=1481888 RepID=A0AAU9ITP5_9CILI|nr:unnamed protein product [Blepharisma stoltei]
MYHFFNLDQAWKKIPLQIIFNLGRQTNWKMAYLAKSTLFTSFIDSTREWWTGILFIKQTQYQEEAIVYN